MNDPFKLPSPEAADMEKAAERREWQAQRRGILLEGFIAGLVVALIIVAVVKGCS